MKEMGSNKSYLIEAIYRWLLDNDCTPYMVVSVDHPLVEVPVDHVKDGQITLNISPSAVSNLLMDSTAVSFSARFSGQPRQIYVPIAMVLALFAKENGQGMAFELEEIQEVGAENKREAQNAKKKKGPSLKVVK